jgi:hypothetical protein
VPHPHAKDGRTHEVGDHVGIGLHRVAHEHPQPAIALHNRIGPHPSRGGNRALAGDFHALSCAVVAQAMVVALQMVADELAHRQRQVPMDAAVFQCRGCAFVKAGGVQLFCKICFMLASCGVSSGSAAMIMSPGNWRTKSASGLSVKSARLAVPSAISPRPVSKVMACAHTLYGPSASGGK